jgi:hypothetical protein
MTRLTDIHVAGTDRDPDRSRRHSRLTACLRPGIGRGLQQRHHGGDKRRGWRYSCIRTLAPITRSRRLSTTRSPPRTRPHCGSRAAIEQAVTVFIGQAMEYEIANVADANFTVVAKVRKSYLPRPSVAP